MNLAEYRAAQDRATAPVVAATVSALRGLAGRPVTPSGWSLLLGVLFPVVVQGRRATGELAARFYLDQRPPLPRPAPPLDPPPYRRDALEHAVARTARTRIADQVSTRAAISDTTAAVARHVVQAGRDVIVTAAQTDRLRWARVPTGRETCAFCWLLASRGPVYRSGDMTRWHDRCDCLVMPVSNPDDWEGRATFLAAQRLWRDSTAGLSGRDALIAFRRAVARTPDPTAP
ncbi:hypothetical protein V5P93_000430 [Actinokineospora auranticolor]|uniref:Uncharacterized protein n=1 Tax=Actinokineospora auranticolor TaxID=155976 RepID=A0A2S6GE60_9PSEU|nr:hypothetical protein [Actinokineospora auranticolor]PPK63515.1 hypothetical protein CLV40_12742 [Actinokineospora auranticolor]